MSFRRSPRREAKTAWEAHNRATKPRLIAHMCDGTDKKVNSLLEYEELKKSGTVARFEIVETES